MRVTVPASSLATQSAPAPATIAVGFAPIGIEVPRVLSRSIRCDGSVDPRDRPRAPAAPPATAGRCRRDPLQDLVRAGVDLGDLRASPSATHSEPAPKARAVVRRRPGCGRSRWRLAVDPRDGAVERLATHMEPPPTPPRPGPGRPGTRRDPPALRVDPADRVLVDARHVGLGTRMTPYAARPRHRTAAATSRASRSRRRGRPRARPPWRRRREVERRVLREDRLVEPAQLAPGSTPISFHQRRARLAVGLERLGLAPRPVQREHAAACSRSRSGCCATSASSSAITLACRPASRSASIAISAARSRRSSSRRISTAANGSSATSASGSPRHSASASRARRSSKQVLEPDRVDVVVGQLQLVAAAVGHDFPPSPSSSRRRCDT